MEHESGVKNGMIQAVSATSKGSPPGDRASRITHKASPEAIKASSIRSQLQADISYGQEYLGHLKKSLLSYRRQVKARVEARQHEASMLWRRSYDLALEPPQSQNDPGGKAGHYCRK